MSQDDGGPGVPGGEPEPEVRARIHRALSSVSRVRIFALLEGGPADVSSLSAATGLHYNTVRNHLEVLALAGLVTRGGKSSGRPGRPSVQYRLADPPSQPPGDSSAARVLLEVLIAAVRDSADDPSAATGEAAHSLGRAQAQGTEQPETLTSALERVTALLDELGFAPELVLGAGSAQVLLHRCPFDDLARRYGDIVCAAHLGIIRGALAELGATVHTELRPFVAPDLCLVDIEGGEGAPALPLLP